MTSSKIHCYYIIISIDFKEKHTIEQDELFCCVIISFGLKENMWLRQRSGMWLRQKIVEKEKSLPFSPPQEPWTPFASRVQDSINLTKN